MKQWSLFDPLGSDSLSNRHALSLELHCRFHSHLFNLWQEQQSRDPEWFYEVGLARLHFPCSFPFDLVWEGSSPSYPIRNVEGPPWKPSSSRKEQLLSPAFPVCTHLCPIDWACPELSPLGALRLWGPLYTTLINLPERNEWMKWPPYFVTEGVEKSILTNNLSRETKIRSNYNIIAIGKQRNYNMSCDKNKKIVECLN